jgi:protein phosphatase
MQISSFGITDPGKTRQTNEDALLVDDAHLCYAVADGLGGLPGGAEASQRVVELLVQHIQEAVPTSSSPTPSEPSEPSEPLAPLDFTQLITHINQTIEHEGHKAYPFIGTGSTLTLSQIVEKQLFIGHVGDSAAYLLRTGILKKLTIDHTMEQKFIDEKGEAARAHMPADYAHTLTRCIGQAEALQVDLISITVNAGDWLLLCTDGLSKLLSEAQINETLNLAISPQEAGRRLTQQANAQGGSDNITLIVIEIS